MVHPPAPETTGRPATDAARSTRQRLLAAAYEVLVDEGYQSATVQNVARRAHLTTGAIYANFTSKHELLVEAVLERWAQSPELNPLQLLPSPATEALGDLGELRELPGLPGLEALVGFLADQVAAAPSPEHRLLTEVTGAAIRHDVAMSRLRAGIQVVESFARHAIVRAQDEGRLDDRLPVDVLVTLTVNLYLGAITSKSFNLPQPSHEAVLEVFQMLRLAPEPSASQPAPAPAPAPGPDHDG